MHSSVTEEEASDATYPRHLQSFHAFPGDLTAIHTWPRDSDDHRANQSSGDLIDSRPHQISGDLNVSDDSRHDTNEH